MHICGAKFQEQCFHSFRDIVYWVFYRILRHSSVFPKGFQINRKKIHVIYTLIIVRVINLHRHPYPTLILTQSAFWHSDISFLRLFCRMQNRSLVSEREFTRLVGRSLDPSLGLIGLNKGQKKEIYSCNKAKIFSSFCLHWCMYFIMQNSRSLKEAFDSNMIQVRAFTCTWKYCNITSCSSVQM